MKNQTKVIGVITYTYLSESKLYTNNLKLLSVFYLYFGPMQ